jgi:hypothetical protein
MQPRPRQAGSVAVEYGEVSLAQECMRAWAIRDLRASEVVFSCVFGFRQWLIPTGR